MSSDDGGDGMVAESRRREAAETVRDRFFFTAFFDLAAGRADRFEAAGLLTRGTGFAVLRRAAAVFRAGFAAAFRFGVAFLAGGAAFVAAVLRADFLAVDRKALFCPALAFFFVEAAVDLRLALRLAMLTSFRNLDSLAISVVLSDAYRKSERRFRAPADRNCGPPDPATRTPALVRVSRGFSGPVVRRQEECARHGKC
jgi:hypothetical protein